MKIDFLVNHPHFIETLAPPITQHWQPIVHDETLDTRKAKLRTHMNERDLPIAWVAYEGSTVFGTASLRVNDLPGYEHLTPWLGGVFVLPQYRGKGIGAALCTAVEHHAANVTGISRLYLFTLDLESWYQHMGWQTMETCTWCDQDGVIMLKDLNTPSSG
ncbi:MAG: GNAT family N-acetyltransferase [Gammaproteobacteria bacterium]|nr:GNAT family N-acetyltransferase [Gammaproteobacteria bacterium]